METEEIKKVIAVEGVDLSGKSTFAAKFGHIVPKNYVVPQKLDDLPIYFDNLKLYIEAGKQPGTVLDRCLISEWVYGPIKRGYNSRKDVAAFIEQNQFILKDVTFLIFVPSKKTLKANYEQRGDEYVSLDEAMKARKLYLRFYKKFKAKLDLYLVSW